MITLAIIGVVAAITMPVLIQKHKNHVAETRLKKFYTTMNQAIKMSEAEYGPKELWDFNVENFWDIHFAPYVKVLKPIESFNEVGGIYTMNKVYFPDGSLAVYRLKVNGSIVQLGGCNIDYFFFPNAKNFDETTFNPDIKGVGLNETYFLFQFFPNASGDYYSYYETNKGLQPFSFWLKEDLSNLKSGNNYGCSTTTGLPYYCTFYIMQNGWKIPDDYPFKVR